MSINSSSQTRGLFETTKHNKYIFQKNEYVNSAKTFSTTGNLLIDGNRHILYIGNGISSGSAFTISAPTGDVILKNLVVDLSGSHASLTSVFEFGGEYDNLIIENCDFYGFSANGEEAIRITTANSSNITTYPVIRDCRFYNTRSATSWETFDYLASFDDRIGTGINVLTCRGLHVLNCQFMNIGFAVKSSSGTLKDLRIEGCHLRGLGCGQDDSTQNGGAIWIKSTSNVDIDLVGNKFYLMLGPSLNLEPTTSTGTVNIKANTFRFCCIYPFLIEVAHTTGINCSGNTFDDFNHHDQAASNDNYSASVDSIFFTTLNVSYVNFTGNFVYANGDYNIFQHTSGKTHDYYTVVGNVFRNSKSATPYEDVVFKTVVPSNYAPNSTSATLGIHNIFDSAEA